MNYISLEEADRIYQEQVSMMNDVQYVYHYTSIEVLYLILKSRKIRLTRLDRVNDLSESNRLGIEWAKRIYVSCFTNERNESIPLWKMYAKPGVGVRLGLPKFNIDKALFNFPQDRIVNADWLKIKYDNILIGSGKQLTSTYRDESGTEITTYHQIPSCHPGVIKGVPWEYEQECRIRLYLDGIPFELLSPHTPKKDIKKFDRAFNIHRNYPVFTEYPLNNDCLDDIEILFNPWINKDFFEFQRRSLCREFGFLRKSRIQLSDLHSTIANW